MLFPIEITSDGGNFRAYVLGEPPYDIPLAEGPLKETPRAAVLALIDLIDLTVEEN